MKQHPINTVADQLIDMQLERYAWLRDLPAGWDCKEDALCRCRKCRPGHVERKWA